MTTPGTSRHLATIELLLPRYYENAQDYMDSFRNRSDQDGLMIAEINARTAERGLSSDLLRHGWVTPEGRVLNEETRQVRKLQKALRGFIKECQEFQPQEATPAAI